MLSIENLKSSIFGPVTVKISPGQTLVVKGASGSGKTRFLRAVADLDEHQGDVLLDGRPCRGMPAFEWRRRVRFVPADSGWWHETVRPHFMDASGLSARLAALDLRPALLEMAVSELSTGERQRLAFLRAIEDQPAVLLLDEPTAALDEQSVARMEALMDAELARGAILIMASHSAAQMEKYGARCLSFDQGKVVLGGGAEDRAALANLPPQRNNEGAG